MRYIGSHFELALPAVGGVPPKLRKLVQLGSLPNFLCLLTGGTLPPVPLLVEAGTDGIHRPVLSVSGEPRGHRHRDGHPSTEVEVGLGDSVLLVVLGRLLRVVSLEAHRHGSGGHSAPTDVCRRRLGDDKRLPNDKWHLESRGGHFLPSQSNADGDPLGNSRVIIEKRSLEQHRAELTPRKIRFVDLRYIVEIQKQSLRGIHRRNTDCLFLYLLHTTWY